MKQNYPFSSSCKEEQEISNLTKDLGIDGLCKIINKEKELIKDLNKGRNDIILVSAVKLLNELITDKNVLSKLSEANLKLLISSCDEEQLLTVYQSIGGNSNEFKYSEDKASMIIQQWKETFKQPIGRSKRNESDEFIQDATYQFLDHYASVSKIEKSYDLRVITVGNTKKKELDFKAQVQILLNNNTYSIESIENAIDLENEVTRKEVFNMTGQNVSTGLVHLAVQQRRIEFLTKYKDLIDFNKKTNSGITPIIFVNDKKMLNLVVENGGDLIYYCEKLQRYAYEILIDYLNEDLEVSALCKIIKNEKELNKNDKHRDDKILIKITNLIIENKNAASKLSENDLELLISVCDDKQLLILYNNNKEFGIFKSFKDPISILLYGKKKVFDKNYLTAILPDMNKKKEGNRLKYMYRRGIRCFFSQQKCTL